MATVHGKKANAQQFDPRKHVLHGHASHGSYLRQGDRTCLAYMRGGPKDCCVWVKLGDVKAETLPKDKIVDTSWVADVHHAAQTYASNCEAVSGVPKNFNWHSTKSEEQRAKRRTLRKVSRKLRKKKRQRKLQIVRPFVKKLEVV